MSTINLTTILGTDSLAGSRITINENFSLLADTLNGISNYIVVGQSTATIKSIAEIETNSIKIANSGNIAEFKSSGITFDKPFEIKSNVQINSKLILSTYDLILTDETSSYSLSTIDKALYRIEGPGVDIDFILGEGISGQKITIIKSSGAGGIDVKHNDNPLATLTLIGSNVSLIYMDNTWYVLN